ncbi:hypothetical protein [Halosimplex salinum]|uniref:hypothetical protein n=1 Tax=Halosimplex salinum TaxID=1710538 RepID=UPI001F36C9CF|nr:hypothetical protein [Halosimplex salinum]
MSEGTDPRAPKQAPGYDVADPESKEFGRRGWFLVAVLVLAFVVIPWSLIALPAAGDFAGSIGLGWRDAYLVLPLIPALLLGVVGVWTAVESRRP